MGTAVDALNWLRARLGAKETPDGANFVPGITDRFADLSGWEWARRGNPWCDMTQSLALSDGAGIPTIYAYTPAHLAAFKSGVAGTFIGGKDTPAEDLRPGDIVFYSFGGKRTDHVEMIEVPGAKLTTLGGNVGNALRRQVRGRSQITGFGRPGYSDAPAVPAPVQPPASPPGTTVPLARIAADMPLLRRRTPMMRGRAVEFVQQSLGWAPGGDPALDGIFGDDTKSGVKFIQGSGGLAVDGDVGGHTWMLILQADLTRAGYPCARDGETGPETSSALFRFQQDHGLVRDGIAGYATFGALTGR